MALDPIIDNLLIGWYDGRNYDDNSLNYFGTVIDVKPLDQLVEQIPLSNPVYSIPAGGFTAKTSIVTEEKTPIVAEKTP